MKELIIDKDFYNLTVPYTEEQQERLEQSILQDGCLEPIITWNGVIIDGHKRYLFCKDEGIDCEVREVFFPSRVKAMAWVCRRRVEGLTPGTPIYKYLHGKWFNCLKPAYQEMVEKDQINYTVDPDGRIRIAKVIADDLGFNYSTVENNQVYANHIDKIARSAPDLFRAMMAGQIRVTIKEVRALSHGDARVRRDLRNKLSSDKEPKSNRGRPRKQSEEDGILLSTRIKEMPAFDPDMAIRGLTLTLPTWMAAIARAEKQTDMELATDYAKKQLAEGLMRLDMQIQKTLEAIECMEKQF
jgi:hypothetical protein